MDKPNTPASNPYRPPDLAGQFRRNIETLAMLRATLPMRALTLDLMCRARTARMSPGGRSAELLKMFSAAAPMRARALDLLGKAQTLKKSRGVGGAHDGGQ
ncbi:MAG: hypothetical protein ABSC13_06305 [Dehalococcoidia bacterium]|jgi:hypothetical protein